MDEKNLQDFFDVEIKTNDDNKKYLELYKRVKAMSLEEIAFAAAIKGNTRLEIGGEEVINLNSELLIRLLLAVNEINKKLKIND